MTQMDNETILIFAGVLGLSLNMGQGNHCNRKWNSQSNDAERVEFIKEALVGFTSV